MICSSGWKRDEPTDLRSDSKCEDDDVSHWDADHADEGRAPICPSCGVTALPSELSNVIDSGFVCDNADCEAYGEPVDS